MKKKIFLLFVLFSLSAHAADSGAIWLPNLPSYATGTDLGGGHVGLDINGVLTPAGTQDVNLTEVGGAAVSLGQKTMADSIPAVISSDQSPIPISPIAGSSGTLVQSTTVGSGAAVSFVAPANAISATIEASSSNSQNIRCAAGTTPTISLGLRLEPGRSVDNLLTSATIRCIAESGSNQEIDIQWISQ